MSYLRTLILNHRRDVVDRVIKTDVLIIDEVSMLSCKLFEQVETVCSLKNQGILFGGIQIILSGDFYQLPPVRNSLYGDTGAFCFESDYFQFHTIILQEVIRQTDANFINVVNEAARGALSPNSVTLLGQLCRPIESNNFVHLFSTNKLVDSYNRSEVLKMENDRLFEYIGEDSGEKKYLQRILAPHNLWIKTGCPVILLRNISDVLVNSWTSRKGCLSWSRWTGGPFSIC